MSPKIFISYRHHDNPDFVHRMRDLLIPHYGTDNIFLDAYSIPAGMPFAKFIEIKIREYDAVIAVVGPQWLPLLREKASLFQDDYVRKELEWSLKYDKVIIPVCIKDATLPAKTDLPPELRPLLDLNAITISDGLHFTADVARIVEGITTLLRERPANSTPAYLLNGNAKAAFLEPFLADGWGTCMSLAEHPALLHGKSWAMKEVRLQHRPIKFTVPVDHKDAYQHYFDSSYDKKRFFDDGEKVMLEHVPHTSIDSPTLMLETLQTQYSVTKYYSEIIAPSLSDRDHIINTLIEQGKVNCAHSFCMHAIIVTSDDKVLITQRSWRVAYYPSAWQCTLSEQFALEDLAHRQPVLRWGQRMLEEELSLYDESAYDNANLRLLSVFLEGELLNISACAYITLNLDADTLDKHLRANPPDPEFNGNWIFLEHRQLLDELFTPSREYHPSSPYLMFMSLLHRYGLPMKETINQRLATVSKPT